MTAGRPTSYSEEIIEKANKYIDQSKDTDIQVIKQSNAEKGYEMYENKLKVNIPTIEGLAVYLGVARSTIYEWQKEHKEFSDILEKLLAIQAERLMNNGLSGDYNSTIAKVILTKHGYVDKQESDVNLKGKISLSKLFDESKENE